MISCTGISTGGQRVSFVIMPETLNERLSIESPASLAIASFDDTEVNDEFPFPISSPRIVISRRHNHSQALRYTFVWRRLGSKEKLFVAGGEEDVPIFADIEDALSKSFLLDSCSRTEVLSSLERLVYR